MLYDYKKNFYKLFSKPKSKKIMHAFLSFVYLKCEYFNTRRKKILNAFISSAKGRRKKKIKEIVLLEKKRILKCFLISIPKIKYQIGLTIFTHKIHFFFFHLSEKKESNSILQKKWQGFFDLCRENDKCTQIDTRRQNKKRKTTFDRRGWNFKKKKKNSISQFWKQVKTSISINVYIRFPNGVVLCTGSCITLSCLKQDKEHCNPRDCWK